MNEVPTLYDHELASYEREISRLATERAELPARRKAPGFNLTHFALGVSNRSNLLVVGLTSLVEIMLYEVAKDRETSHKMKLEAEDGKGLAKVKNYLKHIKAIDFCRLVGWDQFEDLYTVRNAIVHGYGGVVPPRDEARLKAALQRLQMTHVMATSRVRFDTRGLQKTHKIVRKVIDGIQGALS